MAVARALGEERVGSDERVPLILSTKPLSHIVWQLAWPILALSVIQTINTFVDRRMVSSLGTYALAGTGIGQTFIFFWLSLAMALGAASTALVARFYGARDLEQARKALNQCVRLALALGAMCLVLSFALLHPMLWAMVSHAAKDAPTRLNAARLLSAALFAIPGMFVFNVMAGALRAIGDTRSPMFVSVGMVVVHLAISATFIFGLFGAPRLGVMGSGIGIAANTWFGVLVFLPILARRDTGPVHDIRLPEWNWVVRIARLGYPSTIQQLARTFGMLIFAAIVQRTVEGSIATAAFAVGIVAESIAFMPGMSYAMAAAALVGQSLGAKVPERGERATWVAIYQALAIMGSMSVLLFVFAEHFARIFTGDPAVVTCTVHYLRICMASEWTLPFLMVCMMALQGAGDTFRAMVIAITSMWLFRIPLALILALTLHWGADGAWWAMTIATWAGAIQGVYVFKRGKWKQARV